VEVDGALRPQWAAKGDPAVRAYLSVDEATGLPTWMSSTTGLRL
jgi:hypothetical protein